MDEGRYLEDMFKFATAEHALGTHSAKRSPGFSFVFLEQDPI